MRMSAIALACFALGLAGCASMSKDECLTVDWRTVGYEDGAAGRGGEAIGRHRKACADHGVAPDLRAYQAGRAEGLQEYCQPQNGFRIGANGAAYGGVCPAELAPAFTEAYETGRGLYQHEYRVGAAAGRIASIHGELDGITGRLTELGLLVIDRDTTGEARAQALIETQQLVERRQELRAEMAQLERDKQRYERELADYRAQVAYVD